MKLHIYMYLLIMDWWSRAGRRRYHVVKQAKYILVNSFLHTLMFVCVSQVFRVRALCIMYYVQLQLYAYLVPSRYIHMYVCIH